MSFITLPFSYIMKGCVWIAQNSYLFGLLFYALVFQLILFPLQIKQQKSQVKMASIRPKEMAIRKKYAGRTDRVTQQRMQQEIQEMYQQNGYSPFSGCLPLLVQLPLVMILCTIVYHPVQYASHFDDIVKNNVTAVTTEKYEELTADTAFETLLSQYAFDYAEDIRSHLVKDNETAKKANDELLEKLGELGELTDPAEDQPKIYENGFARRVLNKQKMDPYQEMGAADIIQNYGADYIQSLREAGALDGTYDPNAYPLTYEKDGEVRLYADEMPSFSFLGVNLLMTPSFTNLKNWHDWVLLLIPILVFLTSFFSTKIVRHYQPAPAGADGTQPGSGLFMTIGMPLMSTVFCFMFPAGIGVYWIWRTLFSMVQPIILHKMYPIPQVSQEEIDAAEREMKSKKKKKVITIEVDEDDDSYRDLEVHDARPDRGAKPKQNGASGKKTKSDLPYRKPTTIEMLSADEDDSESSMDSESEMDSDGSGES